MVIVWSPRARHEFDAAIDYIKRESPSGAKRVAERIEKRVNELRQFAGQGVALSRGLRRLDVSRTPYMVIYRVEQQTITIVAILHHARKRRS